MLKILSKAEFIDGPMKGTIRGFDRQEPPLKFYASHPVTDAPLTYLRDINPYGDGEEWIYILEFERFPDFDG